MLELVGLTGREDARAADLSGGQRRRLDLALGIAGDPELIFLDEPTTGFDPAARRQSWELIGGLRELGKTILLTTHYMDEAQHLADRVVVLANGRVIADAEPGAPRPRGGRRDVPGRPRPAAAGRHDRRARHRAARQRARHPRPRARPAVGGGPRRRARGPDRDPPQPRRRLPGADRMTLLSTWIFARDQTDDAQPARGRVHARVPADPDRAVQRAERQHRGAEPTADDPLRPVLHAGDRGHEPRHRVLHDDRDGPGHGPRRGPAQARARHAAADVDLPDGVGGGARWRSASAPSRCCSRSPCRPSALHIYADSLLARDRHAPARRRVPVGARRRGGDAREVRRPGAAGRAAHVPAAVLHLRHLVPARRRAGLARLGRRGVPALPPRAGVRQRVHARTAGGSRSTSPCWRSGRSARC